jgi:hypothetical protein
MEITINHGWETTTDFTSKLRQYALTMQWRDGSESIEYFDYLSDAREALEFHLSPRHFNGLEIWVDGKKQKVESNGIYGIIENNIDDTLVVGRLPSY